MIFLKDPILRSIGWLIDWLTGWLIDWRIDWLIDWCIIVHLPLNQMIKSCSFSNSFTFFLRSGRISDVFHTKRVHCVIGWACSRAKCRSPSAAQQWPPRPPGGHVQSPVWAATRRGNRHSRRDPQRGNIAQTLKQANNSRGPLFHRRRGFYSTGSRVHSPLIRAGASSIHRGFITANAAKYWHLYSLQR